MWFSWFSFGGRFRETADASCSRDSISTSQTGTTSSTSNQLVFPALFESGSSPLRRPFIHPLDLHVTTNFPTSHDEFIGLWFSNSSYHHCLFWVFFFFWVRHPDEFHVVWSVHAHLLSRFERGSPVKYHDSNWFLLDVTGWMDDSVFLRRNEMEDEAWGPNVSGGGVGPGGDAYSHRAFTTGRRRPLPPQQQQQAQLPGHHPHTSRKVSCFKVEDDFTAQYLIGVNFQ